MTDRVTEETQDSEEVKNTKEEDVEPFAKWCQSVETRLEELSAMMRGVIQAQSQMNPKPPEKKVVPQSDKKKQPPLSPEDEEKMNKKREIHRRMMQCELEDINEENMKIRRKIRQMMLAQRDSTLMYVMITALILLVGSIIIHFFFKGSS